MMLLQPQEVEVFYILPAIRRELSISLKSLGKTQKEIATLLGVTDAAVSQYFHDKRGKITFPAELKSKVKASAKRIKDHQSMIKETQLILSFAKETKLICKLHEKFSGDIPRGCDVCFK